MSHLLPKPIPTAFPIFAALMLGLTLAATPRARGQEPISGLLQESTFMVVSVDTARLALPKEPALLQRLPESLRLDLLPYLDAGFRQLQIEADQNPIQIWVSMPVSGWVPSIHTVRDLSESEINRKRDLSFFQQRLKHWQVGPDAQIRMSGKQVVVGPAVVDPLSVSNEQELAAQFSDVLNANGNLPVKIAIIPPRYVQATLAQTVSRLPPSLGAFPTSVLLDGIQAVGVGFDPQTLTLKLQIYSADEAAAKSLAESLPTILRSLYRSSSWAVERLPKETVLAAISQLPMQVRADRVVLGAESETVDDVHLQLLGSLVAVFVGKQRTISANAQLKHIGLAVHNHHSAYRYLPPWRSGSQKTNRKTVKEKSNTQLSWRVYLLPFLGESDLFQQFHLNEPWDSPHNKTLLEQMPEIYAGGSREIAAGHTTVVAPLSDRAMLNAAEPTSFLNVVDGLSNTVMVVEVTPDSAVPWTAPQDYEFDAADPFAKLAVDSAERVTVLFGDGSVRKLRRDLDVPTAQALFGRNDHVSIKLD